MLETTGDVLASYGHEYAGRKCRYCDKNEPSLMLDGTFGDSGVI